MTELSTPEAIVQRQLDAYNAKDIEARLATYAPDTPDARQFEHPSFAPPCLRSSVRQRLALAALTPNHKAACRPDISPGDRRQHPFPQIQRQRLRHPCRTSSTGRQSESDPH
jgi:hypothetical protein